VTVTSQESLFEDFAVRLGLA